MSKKILFTLSAILVAIISLFLFYRGEEREADRSPPAMMENQRTAEDPQEMITDDPNAVMIQEVYAHAVKGMLYNLPLIAGETTLDETAEALGPPDSTEETAFTRYDTYVSPDVTIGYNNSVTYLMRTGDTRYQNISYEEIIAELGEPDETVRSTESSMNQTTLIYRSEKAFELIWTLDSYSGNRTVEHITVVSSMMQDKKKEISEILEQIEIMSLDEKIGQMIFAGISGTQQNTSAEALITDHKVGGIIFNGHNLISPDQTVAYLNSLKSANRTNTVPLFFGIDQEGGRVSKAPGNLEKIPTSLSVGNIDNEDFSFELGRALAKLVKSYGFNINFAPVLDVNSNPDNPVIGDRSFGNDPELVKRLGIATMKGLQDEGVIPTIKHFPGHGDTSVDSHLALPGVDKTLTELEDLELIPFEAAIHEGADMVMIAHLLLPQIDDLYPSSMSEIIISDLLRDKMDYNGVVITDDMTMKAISDNYDIGEASVRSVLAGTDIVMVANSDTMIQKAITDLKSAVENGVLSEHRVDESVARILLLKEKYEISDALVENVPIEELNNLIRTLKEEYLE